MEINQTTSLMGNPARKSGRAMKIIIALLIILALAAGTVLAIAKIWQPWWSPFRPTSEKIIEKMLLKMTDLKTFHWEAVTNLKSSESAQEINIKLSGDSDLTDQQNKKSNVNFEVNAIVEGSGLNANGQIISLKDISYLRINTLPFPFSLFVPIQQWIKFDKESLEKLSGKETTTTISTEELSKKISEKIVELVKKKELYSVQKELANEAINEITCYHYLITLNKQAITNLIPDLVNIMKQYSLPITDEQQQSLSEAAANLAEVPMEIWINKNNNYLSQLKISQQIDLSKLNSEASGTVALDFTLNLKNFNQPVTISAPQQFITIDELLKNSPFKLASPTEE